jgi:hypothetical protein
MGLSFSQRLGLRLGIEELTEGATGKEGEVGGTAVLPDAPEETVEGGLMEAGEAEAVVEEETAEAEQLEDSVETLEKIALGLETAMKNGGCTAGEAYAYQIGLESAFRPFGMGATATASLENIGSARNPRLEATRVTLEDVKETLQKWWAGLVAMWEKVYTSIKGWIMKIFDAIPAIKKRAEEIVKKAGEAKGSPKEAKVKYSAAALSTGSTAPTVKSIEDGLAGATVLLQSVLTSTGSGYEGTVSTLVGMLDGLKKGVDEASIKAAQTALSEEFTRFAKITKATKVGSKDKYGGDKVVANISEPVLGNKVVLVTTKEAEEKDGIDTIVSGFSYKLVDNADAKSAEGSEVEAADGAAVAGMAKSVITICERLAGYRAVWQARDKSKKDLSNKVSAAVNDATKDLKGDGSSEKVTAVKKVAKAVQAYNSKVVSGESQVASYGAKLCQNVLNYANKCLDNLGEGKKEEPAK